MSDRSPVAARGNSCRQDTRGSLCPRMMEGWGSDTDGHRSDPTKSTTEWPDSCLRHALAPVITTTEGEGFEPSSEENPLKRFSRPLFLALASQISAICATFAPVLAIFYLRVGRPKRRCRCLGPGR